MGGWRSPLWGLVRLVRAGAGPGCEPGRASCQLRPEHSFPGQSPRPSGGRLGTTMKKDTQERGWWSLGETGAAGAGLRPRGFDEVTWLGAVTRGPSLGWGLGSRDDPVGH